MPPDPQDAINESIESLTRRLLDAERTNADLRRLMRVSGEGAWKSPVILLFLLFALLGGAFLGHAAAAHMRSTPAQERIE
jgi:hypothetical protein